jgi:tetratricopeptide (TPR) repeat protein
VLVALLQQSASTQPLRIVIEDAHWMDSASWALALAVVRQVQPLLLVLITRPHTGNVPSDHQVLFERPESLHLRLEALRSSDTIQLVCQRLGVDVLPEQVAALILEKAEGHPFFSEELAYALRDSGVLQIVDRQAQIAPGVDFKSLNLPDTVEGVVTSRIDLLTPGQQLTVKVASVIGRIFSYRVLEDIHPVAMDRLRLAEYLDRLQNLDVTPLATPPPDLSYMFKHIITQEVAYNLLLFSQRRQLHQAVAEWHERAFAHDLSPFYPLLAHHWLSASESDPDDAATLKAIEYLEKAGDAALRSYANREAVDDFSKLLGIVNPRTSKSFGVSFLRMAQWEHQLGEAYNRLGYMVECEQHFTRSLQYLDWPLPKKMGRVAMALAGQITRQAWIRIQPNGTSARRQFSEDALEARRLACKIYERLGLLYFLKNKPGLEAFYCPLASLNLAEEIGPSPELAIAYSYVAGGAGLVPAHGLARLYERLSLDTAGQVNNPLITARVLMATSVYSAGTGRFEETDQRLRRAIASFEQGGVWEWWGVCVEMLTRVTYYQGQFQHASELANRLYNLTKQQGDILQRSWALSSRMEALLMLGEHDDILKLAGEMEVLATQSHETGSLQKSLGVSAHVHLQRGEWTRAEERARQLLTIISSESPTSFGLLTVYTAAAEVYLSLWELQALPDVESLKQQATLACKLLTRYAKVLPIGESARLRTSGVHAWLSGNRSQAQSLWNQSLARAKEMHMPLEEALANYELGRHLPEGDPFRQACLGRSQEIFRQLGAGYYLARVLRALPKSDRETHDAA